MSDFDTIFKAYDVRGTVPDQLNSRMCRAIGWGFARFAQSQKVIVGRDMRGSGVELSAAFSAGARAAGVDVVEIGLASTDLFYFASGRTNLPGAMFTASHNPAQYNGMKFCLSGARPVGVESGLGEVKAIAEQAMSAGEDLGDPKGQFEYLEFIDEYANHVRSFLPKEQLRPLSVVADTANGMGGLVVPAVFDGLGVELHVLFGELDGTFPNHPADPIQPANLVDLKKSVLERGADVGLAFDGDADRVFLVDERAHEVSGSLTTALVARAMLEKHPGATILYNIICSHVVPETILEYGGKPVRTRVGHSYIKGVMAETDAVFGGEHSGHYYFRDNFRADSGIIAAMVVLGMMSTTGRPLSALLAPYRKYSDSGEVNLEHPDPAGAVEAVAEKLIAAGEKVDRTDGLTVEHSDWWFNLRPSNTEPLLRLNVEAQTDQECEEHVREVIDLVTEASGKEPARHE
ncbi:MAG: phosphomannomutase/phosphoglucomutase [Acidimicrobiales bacterium]